MNLFRRHGPGFWLRLLGLGLLDGIVLALIPSLISQDATIAVISIIVGTIGINWIFVSSKTVPFRWLVPGLFFMVLMVVWPIIFTMWVALTNWSTGNFITKPQAIERITEGTRYRITDPERSPIVDLYLYRDPAEASDLDPLAGLTMLIQTQEGDLYYGVPRLVADPVPEDPELIDLAEQTVVDEDGDGIPEQIGDAVKLRLLDIGSVNAVLDQLVLDIPERGVARARTFSTAQLAENRFAYDEAADVLLDRLNPGTPCTITEGTFYCADGERIDPGWRVYIGFDNFGDFITNERIRTPFLRIFVWNVIFAAVVVIFQLAIGLGLAVTFDDKRMRGRGWLRSLLIIPWAAPGFIMIIVWRGLLNQSFGPFNKLLDTLWPFVDGVAIPWLSDPFWAKIAVILVTVWQGFPYFFLISTGALQSIPSELKEAARVDGASAFAVFRKVTFPLLMVGIAPLVIASFAFNFNAFVNIFLLTQGGPAVNGYDVPFGETDILISFIFDLAVQSGRGGQFALAAAATFFLFLIVATISAISFRFTKRLETIYGNL